MSALPGLDPLFMSNEDREKAFERLRKRLPSIKSLAMLKMEKNFIALEKGYPRQPYAVESQPLAFLIMRLKEEFEELEQSYKLQNLPRMKEECADISNIVDYIFEKLLGGGC